MTRRRIAVSEIDLSTSCAGVFAGGDGVTGLASVVQAIAHGRQAAAAIDRYLGGSGRIEETLAPAERLHDLPPLQAETKARPRIALPCRSSKGRVGSFAPVEQGYSQEAAIREASRCLRCDLEP